MEQTVFISESLGTIDDGKREVCATAEASYDGEAQAVCVQLDAFTRKLSAEGHGQHLPESWLPTGERVIEHLPREEASSFARDVFKSWIRKVREAIPDNVSVHS